MHFPVHRLPSPGLTSGLNTRAHSRDGIMTMEQHTRTSPTVVTKGACGLALASFRALQEETGSPLCTGVSVSLARAGTTRVAAAPSSSGGNMTTSHVSELVMRSAVDVDRGSSPTGRGRLCPHLSDWGLHGTNLFRQRKLLWTERSAWSCGHVAPGARFHSRVKP